MKPITAEWVEKAEGDFATDEANRPVAVQIDYRDWYKIEEALGQARLEKPPTDLARHIGKLKWPVDGLEYQRQVRSAWNSTMCWIPMS